MCPVDWVNCPKSEGVVWNDIVALRVNTFMIQKRATQNQVLNQEDHLKNCQTTGVVRNVVLQKRHLTALKSSIGAR